MSRAASFFLFGIFSFGFLTLSSCSGGGGGEAPASQVKPIDLSGTISTPVASVMDNDVDDPEASYESNNFINLAQVLPNPAIVGGFVSAEGSGTELGRFAYEPDQFDCYSVSLASGQTVTLAVSDFGEGGSAVNDLDLYLLDSGSHVIASSMGDTASESLVVPASGDYFIKVVADSGVSNYVMTVGYSTVSVASSSSLRLEDEFVPGEVVMRFKDNLLASSLANGDSPKVLAEALGLEAKAGGRGRASLCRLPEEGAGGRQRVQAILGVKAWGYDALGAGAAQAELRGKYDTLQIVKALRRRADVVSADPNYIRHPAVSPDDTYYAIQWHYPLVNLPQAWEVTTDAGGDVIVAVVDTGVYMTHPDLAGNLLATGYDFISDLDTANDGDGIDADPDDPGDGNTPGGSSFHGTHVAGTIAASSDNAKGVAGVSWGSKVMPVRVLGKGGGTSYDVIQGMRYAAGLSNDSSTVPPQAAHIINLSMGGGSYSQTEQDIFTEIRNQGVIIVASAGMAFKVSVTSLLLGVVPSNRFNGKPWKTKSGSGWVVKLIWFDVVGPFPEPFL